MLDQNQYVKTKIALDNNSDSRISLFSVERRWLSDDDLFADEFKIKIQRVFSLSNLTHDEEIGLNYTPLCDDNILMVHQEAFNRNLLKNSFGTGNESRHKCSSSCEVQSRVDFKECPKFQHWNIVESEGTGWKVTPSFEETESVPEDVGSSCFAASSRRCAKMQIVSLSDEGLLPELIDRVRPPLEVSESCAANTNNGSIYELRVSLLDKLQNPVREYREVRYLQPGDRQWQRVYFLIQDYPPGIRFVMFYHSGLNINMAGGSIIAKLPCSSAEDTR